MLLNRGKERSEVKKKEKDHQVSRNEFNMVPINILRFYNIGDDLFEYNSPKFVFIRCNFDILRFIKRNLTWKCFLGELNDREKTRDVLYQIADIITGNTENPRRVYGTRIKDIISRLEKAIPDRRTVILTKKIDPGIIPKIADLDLAIRVIAHPTRGWNEISRHNMSKLCQIVTIDSSAQMLEHVLRAYITGKSRETSCNPWGNITPQALIQILSESDGNLPLFIRIVEQTMEHELVSTKNITEIVKKAWNIHLERDIDQSEWYILKNVASHSTKDNMKNSCNEISKTEFEHLFRSLLGRGLIQRSRSYDSRGNKHIHFRLTPMVSENVGVIS